MKKQLIFLVLSMVASFCFATKSTQGAKEFGNFLKQGNFEEYFPINNNDIQTL